MLVFRSDHNKQNPSDQNEQSLVCRRMPAIRKIRTNPGKLGECGFWREVAAARPAGVRGAGCESSTWIAQPTVVTTIIGFADKVSTGNFTVFTSAVQSDLPLG